MNNGLISKAALQKSMAAVVFENAPVEHQLYMQVVCDTFKHVVNEAPAVDAEPVRHGRWMENIVKDVRANPPYSYKNGYECSLCGRITRANKEPYCHCGAKMDLEVQESK